MKLLDTFKGLGIVIGIVIITFLMSISLYASWDAEFSDKFGVDAIKESRCKDKQIQLLMNKGDQESQWHDSQIPCEFKTAEKQPN